MTMIVLVVIVRFVAIACVLLFRFISVRVNLEVAAVYTAKEASASQRVKDSTDHSSKTNIRGQKYKSTSSSDKKPRQRIQGYTGKTRK